MDPTSFMICPYSPSPGNKTKHVMSDRRKKEAKKKIQQKSLRYRIHSSFPSPPRHLHEYSQWWEESMVIAATYLNIRKKLLHLFTPIHIKSNTQRS